MGKSQAQIQKEYRERKKAKEGGAYKQRERERVKRYYVPISQRSKKEKKERREKVNKWVTLHRMRKQLDTQNETAPTETSEISTSTSSALTVNDECEVSSSTACSTSGIHSPLIVKLPNCNPKIRSRKRISRATAKCRREIEKLREEKERMTRKFKTVSKRFERLRKKNENATPENTPKRKSPERDAERSPINVETPRKRTATELRARGITPRKVPKVVLDKLVFANVVGDEIRSAWNSNGQKGKKVIRNIISGKGIQMYRLKRRLGLLTGIKRTSLKSSTKKCDTIPSIQKRVAARDKLRRQIETFLERDENSRVMPGKADKTKTKDGHVQTRVLNDNMSNLRMKFVTETTTKISLATFCRLRPKYIRLTKYITRNKCLCQKHQNMALLLRGAKCVGADVPLSPDEYARKLKEANPQNLITSVKNPLIKYQQWMKVSEDDGKKRTKVVEKEVETEAFCKKFLEASTEFKEHVNRVNLQYKAMKELKDNLPEGHIIVQMDFSENFTCISADEVQSAYFNSSSVTLHPTVVYYRKDGALNHKSIMFVSDDNGHNVGAVYTFMKKLLPEVRSSMDIEHVHYWTDSPSSQYRNKTAFYITSAHKDTFGVSASWDYFEAGHGKGPCDGLGGAAKRMADLSVKQGKCTIQGAKDFFDWGQNYQKSVKYIYVSKSECDKSREEIAEINKTLTPVHGTLTVHSVIAAGVGKVKIKVTSCYCEKCLAGNDDHEGATVDVVKQKKPEASAKSIPKRRAKKPTDESTVIPPKVGKPTEESTVIAPHAEKPTDEPIVLVPEDAPDEGISTSSHVNSNSEEQNIEDPKQQDTMFDKDSWVSVNLEGDWYIGKILEVDLKDKDCKVTFMRRTKDQNTSFKWPAPVDELWVNFSDIICQIDEPIPLGRSGRSFRLNPESLEKIDKAS